jgi:hypothetical protein
VGLPFSEATLKLGKLESDRLLAMFASQGLPAERLHGREKTVQTQYMYSSIL